MHTFEHAASAGGLFAEGKRRLAAAFSQTADGSLAETAATPRTGAPFGFLRSLTGLLRPNSADVRRKPAPTDALADEQAKGQGTGEEHACPAGSEIHASARGKPARRLVGPLVAAAVLAASFMPSAAQAADPAIAAIAPAGGSTGGGTSVTITGTDFVNGNTFSATFGATTVAASYVNATTLTATTPAGTGTVLVTVTDTTQSRTSTSSVSYAYAAPTVTGLSVTAGPANVPRAVTITGTNFTRTATVTVGGTAATGVAYASATQLTATLPAKPAGTYNVQVTEGPATSNPNPPADQYTYIPAPTVTNVTPDSGTTGGETPVTISGSNLRGVTAVTFGGAQATNVVVAGDGNSLTATTPSGSAGAVNVAVATPGGTGTLAGGYEYVAPIPPGVTTQPANGTVAAGGTTTFNAAASGTPPPTVQWQVSSDGGGTFQDIAGATAASYTTPAAAAADNGKQFRAVFTNSQGTATTQAAVLTVTAPPAVTANPSNQTVSDGATASFTAAASGNPSPTVQWQVAASGANTFTNIAGATAPTYSFTAASQDTGKQFRAVFTNQAGTATTAAATLTVNSPPTVIDQPAAQTVSEGATASFSASAEGNPTPTVQWQESTDGGTWLDIAGATSPGYTTPSTAAADNGKQFRAVFTNSAGTATSNAAALTVIGRPTANNQSVAVGYNTSTAVTLSGSDPNAPPRSLTYTVTTGPAHGTLSGTAPNLTFTPTADYTGSDSFTFTVNNGSGTSGRATVSLTIGPPPPPAAPVVTVPANGSLIATARPTVTGTTQSNTTVAIFIDGAQRGTVTVTNPTFSFTVPVALAEGSHTVYAVASNTGGPSPQSNTNTFTVDSLAPAAPTVTAPANGARTGARRPVVTGAAESGTSVSVSINGSPAVTVASNGSYSFTPTADLPSGTNTVTVFARDAAGNQSPEASSTFTVVAQPAIGSVSPPEGSLAGGTTITVSGSAFTGATSVAVGSVPASAFTITSDSQLIATTPEGTAAGPVNVSVTTVGGTGTATGAFTYVAAPTASDQTVSVAFQPDNNASVSVAITVTGSDPGSRPLTFAAVTNPTKGTLTGFANGAATATYYPGQGARGTDSFRFSASNGVSTAEGTVTINIVDPTLTLTGPSPGATRGASYSSGVTVAGGTGSYSFQLTGSLPPGLTLASSGTPAGTITGTPTASGSFTFTITAQDDGAGNPPVTATEQFTIDVAGPALTSSPPAGSLPGGTVGTFYSQTFTTNGGTAPYSYTATGSLPPGMVVSGGGSFSGRPTQAGSFSFSVTATDSSTAGSGGPYTKTTAYSISIAAPNIIVLPNSGLPDGQIGTPYSTQLSASGGTAPFAFSASGNLPPNLSLASDGTLSGTPTGAGSYNFTVTATDASTGTGAPFRGSRNYTVTINAPNIAVSPARLPDAFTNVDYSQTITASGGTAPYTYTRSAGTLPSGLTLASNGTLAGKATQIGSFTFTVNARDSSTGSGAPFSQLRSYTLTVTFPTIIPAPSNLPPAAVGAAYSQTLTASGGSGGYTYAVTNNALPAGLTLATGGTISGTPTAGGTFDFTITATDGNGNKGRRPYSLTVGAPTITVAPATLPDGIAGTAYTQRITATGGTAPYSFAASGSVPPGLTLAADGLLQGTPTAAGQFTFTVTAGDGSAGTGPYQGDRSYTLVIAAPGIELSPQALPAATGSVPYSQAIAASGGTAPYRFSLADGALPSGLTLSDAGALEGTPTAAGTYRFTIQATDALDFTGTRAYALAVSAPTIAIAPAVLPTATTGRPYGQTLTATGGIAPYSFALAPGSSLPDGLSLSGSGILSGSVSAPGSFPFTVSVTDANGFAGTVDYRLAVEGDLPAAPDQTVDVVAASSVTVDLTQDATGGPFTAATIVTQPDPSVGTAAIEQDGNDFFLVFTAAPSASGTTFASYTLTNGNGTSAPIRVTFAVAPRPDPSEDEEVVGLVRAQAEAVRRMADGQIGNFRDRLEQTHDEDTRRQGAMDVTVGLPQGAAPVAYASGNDGTTLDATAFATLGYATNDPGLNAAPAKAERRVGNAAFWAGGFVNFGSRDDDGIDFDSTLVGLSGGVDYRFTPQFVAGIGFGYGRDRSEIGGNGTENHTRAFSAAAYASYSPASGFFLDGLLGYSRLDLDSSRFVTGTGDFADGSRSGDQVFGSLTATYEYKTDAVLLAPYLGLEGSSSKLDSFTETGAASNNLSFGQEDASSFSGLIGLRAQEDIKFDWGVLSPRGRLEYSHNFSGSNDVSLGFADAGSQPFGVDADIFSRDRVSLGLGVDAQFNDGWLLGFDYQTELGLDGEAQDHEVSAKASKRF